MDSKEIRASTNDYQVLYFNVENKSSDAHGSQNDAEKQWASNTVISGENAKGLKPASEDGTHINCAVASHDGHHKLTGDDYGLVNIFSVPNPSTSHSLSYSGHSEHVPRVAFSKDGQYVYSIGGADQALIQWRVTSK